MTSRSTINDHQQLDTESLAAFVGIDWGEGKHEGCLVVAGSQDIEHFSLTHKPEELQQWALTLQERFGGRPVAVCLEQSKGPLIYALLKYEFLRLCPINPKQFACYREALQPSGAKDDPTDAEMILDFLHKHPDRVRVWKPDTTTVRLLEQLVEGRRQLVNQRTDMTNRIKSHLKNYFPQAIDVLGGDLTTVLACRFLRKWSRLDVLQRARTHTIRRFFYANNCRSETRLQERLELIQQAVSLATDSAVIEGHQRMVEALIAPLEKIIQAIHGFDKRISELMSKLDDASLFESLPGAGRALAPRLLVAFGSDRDRFQSAEEIQSYSGVAPVTVRSGKTTHVHWRWACPKFLRQTFHEFAQHSLSQSIWAKAFYQMKIDHGHSRQATLRALAYKWIRILCRCWKENTPYDEAHYLTALRKRNSPLLKYIESTSS